MTFLKRTFFFLLVNIAVIFTIGVILQVTGLNAQLAKMGPGYEGLLFFCFIWGMGGAIFSLFISKWMAKRMMGVQIIPPDTHNPDARALVQTVHSLARRAGLPKMPEVGVYQSPEVNAFATGPSKSNALVAVSAGLLQRMRSEELEGVLGHEITHIANGDMVTMTLLQGVVNSFVIFLSEIAAMALAQDDNGRRSFFMEFLLRQVLYVAFSFLAYPIVAAFSRWREYRADAGGAKLAGRDKMIGALRALQGTEEGVDTRQAAFNSMKISGRRRSPIMALYMSHPPLDARIRRLSRGRA